MTTAFRCRISSPRGPSAARRPADSLALRHLLPSVPSAPLPTREPMRTAFLAAARLSSSQWLPLRSPFSAEASGSRQDSVPADRNMASAFQVQGLSIPICSPSLLFKCSTTLATWNIGQNATMHPQSKLHCLHIHCCAQNCA